eukprot:321128-Pyramimonas_sp.AAC.1
MHVGQECRIRVESTPLPRRVCIDPASDTRNGTNLGDTCPSKMQRKKKGMGRTGNEEELFEVKAGWEPQHSGAR